MTQSYMGSAGVKSARRRAGTRLPGKSYGEWVRACRLKHVRDGRYECFASLVGREGRRESRCKLDGILLSVRRMVSLRSMVRRASKLDETLSS
jgi:hypothetical protein